MLTFGFQSKSLGSHAGGARVQRHICNQDRRLVRFTLSPWGEGRAGGRRPEARGRTRRAWHTDKRGGAERGAWSDEGGAGCVRNNERTKPSDLI